MAGRAFAFFWVILIGLVKAQNPLLNACNAQHMQTCQAEFNDELQIGASLGILTYPDLRTAIEQKFASGMAYGLLQTCAAFKNYKFCYANSNEYFSCAENPLGLLIQGVNVGFLFAVPDSQFLPTLKIVLLLFLETEQQTCGTATTLSIQILSKIPIVLAHT
ncbi:unnamed protein product [Caenorhabditis auriculariae]|uniref:DUF19 domain-containing protein n=1 Tax=Caenorhabditis auriculariae TaxID=2777116 RepID=A0A8S1GS38_9PELO|nr:unnamed protein product [Caenorhabditis auriculariae]